MALLSCRRGICTMKNLICKKCGAPIKTRFFNRERFTCGKCGYWTEFNQFTLYGVLKIVCVVLVCMITGEVTMHLKHSPMGVRIAAAAAMLAALGFLGKLLLNIIAKAVYTREISEIK